jgi:hypothetical protein
MMQHSSRLHNFIPVARTLHGHTPENLLFVVITVNYVITTCSCIAL